MCCAVFKSDLPSGCGFWAQQSDLQTDSQSAIVRRLGGRNLPGRPLSRGALHADTLLEVGQHSVGGTRAEPQSSAAVHHPHCLSLLTLLVFSFGCHHTCSVATDQSGEHHRSLGGLLIVCMCVQKQAGWGRKPHPDSSSDRQFKLLVSQTALIIF